MNPIFAEKLVHFNPGSDVISGLLGIGGLRESSRGQVDYQFMLTNLVTEHETIIGSLRKNIDACDERTGHGDTIHFLTRIMNQHETIVNILRRIIDKTIAGNSN
jgi:starvation-inducible DNA-binding protein